MKLPSKVTPFKESIVAKFIPVLDKLKSGPYCLFILEKIKLDEHEEVIHYVKDDEE